MKKVFIFLFLGLSCFIFAEYIEQSYFFDQYTIRQQSEYDLIIMKNTQLHAPAGEPLLPYHSVILLLPTGKKAARIEIILEDETIIGSDHLLLPKQPSKPLSDNSPSDFMINESVYESSAIYPQKNIDVFSTQYFRGHPIVISTFTPFRYIPANGFLSFFKQVTLRVYLQPEDRRSLPADNSESTLQKLTDYVQNPHQISYFPENRPNDETEILIITGAQFENSFQELSEVNLKRGFFTQVISVNTISQTMPGLDDQEKIRNYIKDKYLNNGLNHVLLAGDVEIVPYRGFYCYVQSGNGYESFDIPADLYYSALDGTWDDNGNGIWGEIGEEDLLPEISVARLPFSDQSELDKMLNKAISYQIQPVLGELDRTLLAGENLYNNPLTWGGDYLDLLIGYQNENGYETTGIPIDDDYLTMYDRDLGNWSGSDLINEINLGHPFIHHSGHSNYNYGMRLNMSDITNYNFSGANGIDHNFTLIYSHGCNAGGFDQSDCIAEQMLKIDNFAAAYIGSSRYGWFNEGQTEGPSAHLNREFVDALYNSQINLLGEINSDSKIDTAPWVTAPGQWEEGALRWTFYGTNVLGEVALPVWTAEPLEIFVDYLSVFLMSATDFDLQITENGTPVQGLMCTLIQNGEMKSRGLTDDLGNATLDLSGQDLVPGEAFLYVSGYNCLLSEYPIQIIAGGTYIVVNDYSVFSGFDSVLEFGETAFLSLSIEDIGNAGNVNNLQLTILCLDDFINVIDDVEMVGTLVSGGSLELENAFSFEIDNYVPDNHAFTIYLDMTSDEGSWQSEFHLTAYSADIHLEQVFIVDEGNGILEPGETAILQMELVNNGGAVAYDIMLQLVTSNPYVSVQMLPVQIDSLNRNGGAVIVDVCQINLDEAAPLGEIIQFDLEISAANGYYTQNDFHLITGLLIEDFETGDFDNLNWIMGGYADWTIDNECYEGQFSARSGAISHNSNSSIEITLPSVVAGEISFWKKVSSEANYDFLRFFIDNIMVAEWSGEESWSEEVFAVESGVHTFKWIYVKDQAVVGGDDCAWIDYIIFPPLDQQSSIEDEVLPVSLGSLGNYPNPFNPSTTIEFSILKDNNVELSIFNVKGQKITTLIKEHLPKGNHSIVWSGNDQNGKPTGSGVYLYKINIGSFSSTRKMILLK
jgi:hypothetical protein